MNQNTVNIKLFNGLGDKLLDLIGFYIICKYLNYIPYVTFVNDNQFIWGNNNYDIRLFIFDEIIVSDEKCNFYLNSSRNPSSSLCPYKVYEFIKPSFPEITFEEISDDFIKYSKILIKPSEVILSKIPNNIENAYGIHLRKSDKIIGSCGDIRHENSNTEFEIITKKLLEDVENIIISDDEEEPTFLIVSEDNTWKKEVYDIIMNISNNNNKIIKIIEIDYENDANYCNYNSVLDMFCLSKCKEILQGVKYSTFSILASLLGNHKIRNYSKYTDSYNICLIHSWSSVIEINDSKNFDIEFHKTITNRVINIELVPVVQCTKILEKPLVGQPLFQPRVFPEFRLLRGEQRSTSNEIMISRVLEKRLSNSQNFSLRFRPLEVKKTQIRVGKKSGNSFY